MAQTNSVDLSRVPAGESAVEKKKGLSIALAGVMIVAVSYGWGRYNYGLFLPQIQQEFALTTAWLGLLGSLSYSGYLIATLFTAMLAARLGPRRLIVSGGLCASIGLFLVSQAQSPVMLLLGLVIAGVSPGLCYTPLSDVVVRSYAASKQAKAYAFINTGTGFGVIVAGPLALLLQEQWRQVWLLLAVLALLVTLFNAWHMPSRASGVNQQMPGLVQQWQQLLSPRHRKLYFFAAMVGLVSSVYWTFSVQLLVEASAASGGVGEVPAFISEVFWVLLGIAGCFGFIAANLVSRLGLAGAIICSSAMLAASMLLLAIWPSVTLVALVSALVFGASFVAITALVGIWAVNSFYSQPSAGFGLAFLIMSVGQFVGPFIAGLMAQQFGLAVTFICAALASFGLGLFRPRENIKTLGQ